MAFSQQLINWYLANKRVLPWRETDDAYTIWLSEIILQQTKVNQGLEYFNRFKDKYPTVNDLANAAEEDVLKLWQGLGYYSRARNLHFTAKQIVKNYKGNFPKDYSEILNLKGIGDYTAAAIASFAYNQPYAVVDGNVFRVLSRYFGVETPIDSSRGKKEFKSLAQQLLDKNNPAINNQAIMEFGALQCLPKKPNCETCIFRLECFAYKTKEIENLPKKSKSIKQKTRFFNYLVVKEDENTYLNKRTKNDIWKGLYYFPMIESEHQLSSFDDLKSIKPQFFSIKSSLVNKSKNYKHVLSHQQLIATFWTIKDIDNQIFNSNFEKINKNDIYNYPVPKLIENYIKETL